MLKQTQTKAPTAWHYTFASLFAALVLVMPDFALAAATNSIEGALCNTVLLLSSNLGKALATLGVAILGIGALLGKVSWGMAILVAVGVAALFSATTIVGAISPIAITECATAAVDIRTL